MSKRALCDSGKERLPLRQIVNPSKTVFMRTVNALESGLAARP